jgi:hypothetical protein
VAVLKLTEWLGVVEARAKVSDDIDSRKQRAATTKQGIMRMLACCEEILKTKAISINMSSSSSSKIKTDCLEPPSPF